MPQEHALDMFLQATLLLMHFYASVSYETPCERCITLDRTDLIKILIYKRIKTSNNLRKTSMLLLSLLFFLVVSHESIKYFFIICKERIYYNLEKGNLPALVPPISAITHCFTWYACAIYTYIYKVFTGNCGKVIGNNTTVYQVI